MEAGELQEYAKHLVYEIEMVAGLVGRFHRFEALLPLLDEATATPAELEVLDVVGRNADIEAFATHARALVDFLYAKKKSKGDCVAADFFERPTAWGEMKPNKPRPLSKIRERAGSEVAHLSYSRTAPAPQWEYDAIWSSLQQILRVFLSGADDGKLGTGNRARIARLVGTQSSKDDDLHRLLDTTAVGGLRVGATEAPPFEEPRPSGGTATTNTSPPSIADDGFHFE
jgi:hypothetical protein